MPQVSPDHVGIVEKIDVVEVADHEQIGVDVESRSWRFHEKPDVSETVPDSDARSLAPMLVVFVGDMNAGSAEKPEIAGGRVSITSSIEAEEVFGDDARSDAVRVIVDSPCGRESGKVIEALLLLPPVVCAAEQLIDVDGADADKAVQVSEFQSMPDAVSEGEAVSMTVAVIDG